MPRLNAETVSQIPLISKCGASAGLFDGAAFFCGAPPPSSRENASTRSDFGDMAKPLVACAIVGATKAEQVEESVRAAGWVLSQGELDQIDQICAEPA
jgi:hypothetical protein